MCVKRLCIYVRYGSHTGRFVLFDGTNRRLLYGGRNSDRSYPALRVNTPSCALSPSTHHFVPKVGKQEAHGVLPRYRLTFKYIQSLVF